MFSPPFMGHTAPPLPQAVLKQARAAPAPSCRLSRFPPPRGDSEFRLGLINSSRPRPATAGAVPPDVHSCSQTLARSRYFRIYLHTPPSSQLQAAAASENQELGGGRLRKALPSPFLSSAPQGASEERTEEFGKNEWVPEVIFGGGKKNELLSS